MHNLVSNGHLAEGQNKGSKIFWLSFRHNYSVTKPKIFAKIKRNRCFELCGSAGFSNGHTLNN